MSTRSIYHKTCPACAMPIAVEAKQCQCGYSFDASAPDTDLPPQDQADQEAALMREYLNARIGQAVAELQSNQSALAADPKNLDKANRLMKSYVALHELRAELGVPPANDDPATGDMTATANPTPAFRAAQAQKAEQIMKAAGMDTKECPKCHAVLPQRAALCFCGYAFAQTDAQAKTSTTERSTQETPREKREAR